METQWPHKGDLKAVRFHYELGGKIYNRKKWTLRGGIHTRY